MHELQTAIARSRAVLRAATAKDVEKTIWGSPAGKKRLSKRLAAMLPAHKTYVEPFAGSAAVLFAKELARASMPERATPATPPPE